MADLFALYCDDYLVRKIAGLLSPVDRAIFRETCSRFRQLIDPIHQVRPCMIQLLARHKKLYERTGTDSAKYIIEAISDPIMLTLSHANFYDIIKDAPPNKHIITLAITYTIAHKFDEVSLAIAKKVCKTLLDRTKFREDWGNFLKRTGVREAQSTSLERSDDRETQDVSLERWRGYVTIMIYLAKLNIDAYLRENVSSADQSRIGLIFKMIENSAILGQDYERNKILYSFIRHFGAALIATYVIRDINARSPIDYTNIAAEDLPMVRLLETLNFAHLSVRRRRMCKVLNGYTENWAYYMPQIVHVNGVSLQLLEFYRVINNDHVAKFVTYIIKNRAKWFMAQLLASWREFCDACGAREDMREKESIKSCVNFNMFTYFLNWVETLDEYPYSVSPIGELLGHLYPLIGDNSARIYLPNTLAKTTCRYIEYANYYRRDKRWRAPIRRSNAWSSYARRYTLHLIYLRNWHAMTRRVRKIARKIREIPKYRDIIERYDISLDELDQHIAN